MKCDMWLLFWKAVMSSLYCIVNLLPVCLMYALLQSGQISLYTPDSENISGAGFLCKSRFRMVLVVRRAILRSVLLKMLVM